MDVGPILVVGQSGQLAQCLREAGARHAVSLVTMGRPELDLEDAASIDAVMRELHPLAVINAAAYTAVDAAEQDADRAFAVNRDGAARLAQGARKLGAAFVHVSTDYVFDGRKQEPYVEDDPVCPLGVYGQSKLAGERAVLDAHPDAVVLRTSWVYSPFGNNFVKTMLRLARSHPLVRVVDDQRGTPTAAADLAFTALAIADQLIDGPKAGGIYHASAFGPTTWHDFAAAIFAGLQKRGTVAPVLQAIKTSEYPTAAARPANSVLDCTKLAQTFGISIPHWSMALDRCLDTLCGAKQEYAA
jgi:dTDP-4-dehydrorhamnose reductase